MDYNEDVIIKVEDIKKEYRLGAIGGTTLKEELQRIGARLKKKEDPTAKIDGNTSFTKDKFWALNGISFEIKKGEAVGIIGHNGAGKSTLLKLLCRVTAPTEGQISYNGRIASMLEVGTGFHAELTGRENVYMNGAILGMTKKEIDSKMEEIIEFSECRQFIDTPVKRYSSGMYVKLAFSVAAHLDADIMIMDEVLAVGDMKFQQKCLKKMRQAATEEGKTVLYVSHNMSTITQLCDRCIVLSKGKVIFDGNVDKAIEIYMNNGVDTELRKVYTKYERPEWLSFDDVRLEEVLFVDKENNIFTDNEIVKLKLTLRNNKKVERLCLRWEIYTMNGVPIGTACIDNFYSGEKGKEESVVVSYQFPELVEGSYNSNITFYYRDDDGNNRNVDCVPGLKFEKKFIYDKNIKWDARHWGNIKFSVPEVYFCNF